MLPCDMKKGIACYHIFSPKYATITEIGHVKLNKCSFSNSNITYIIATLVHGHIKMQNY